MEKKLTSGKRKEAVARAKITSGGGSVRINSMLLDKVTPRYVREKMMLPLRIADGVVDLSKIDISVNVQGGGIMGRADAVANAIARGLVQYTENEDLLEKFVSFDRVLIAGDHRVTETHKPGQSSKGPRHKRQKSYR